MKSLVLPIALLGMAASAAAEPAPDKLPFHAKDFVAAHPLRASRYRLPAEIRFAREVDYPARVESITADLSVIAAATMADPDYGVRYAGVAKGLNTVLKRTQGMLEGAARQDAAADRDAQDADFRAWYKARGQQPGGAKNLLGDLDAAVAADLATTRLESAWREATHSELLKSARTLYRLALERQKPDAQRDAGFQERDLGFVKARLTSLGQSFAPSVDQARWQAALVRYSKIDPKFRPPGLDAQLPPPNAVAALYKSTELADTDKRLAWIGKDPDAFRDSHDAFIALAVRMQDAAAALRERRKDVDASLERVIPQYAAALHAWKKAQAKLLDPAGGGLPREAMVRAPNM